jgi:hypothetical protein
VEKQLAVLPVGHRAAGFHRLVAGGLHDEGFVDDHRRVLESRFEIAVRPFVRHLTHWQGAFRGIGKVRLGPFQRLDLRTVLRRAATASTFAATRSP